MSTQEIEQPFDSIESAHDFMSLLAAAILDAIKELKGAHQDALRDGRQRRVQAIELAQFKVKMLGCHVHKSRRVLNDLRILRRLIQDERMTLEGAMAPM